MDETREQELIWQGLAAAGALAGASGGAVVSPAASVGGRAGGSRGARWGARLTRFQAVEEEVLLTGTAADVAARLRAAMSALGPVVEDQGTSISGIVGSGGMNLNPTVLTARVTGSKSDRHTVVLRAAAQEGLIPQRSAPKALARLRARIGPEAQPP